MKLCYDLFSGAGGAAKGYEDAGFHVVGVDHRPQPRYAGSEFVQMDVFEFLERYMAGEYPEADFFHASPPCQHYTRIAQRLERSVARKHPHLVPATRELLKATGKPWVIENVVEARPYMPNAITLCGSSFGLNVRRHRLFASDLLLFPLPCDHSWQTPRFRSLDGRRKQLASVVGVHGHLNYAGEMELREKAMDIAWMKPNELSQAIPPAYTRHLGEQIMWHLEAV